MDLRQEGRFDFQESLLRQIVANGQRDLVTQPEIALHLGAAQVDVAMLEADFFVLDGFFGGRERRQSRVIEDAQFGGFDLDFAGRHLGIDSVLVAQAHLADGGDDVLRPHLFALRVAFGSEFFVEHNLGNAAAVAQVEEDEVAVIAAAVDPAHQHNVFAGVRRRADRRRYGCVPDCLKNRALVLHLSA